MSAAAAFPVLPGIRFREVFHFSIIGLMVLIVFVPVTLLPVLAQQTKNQEHDCHNR
jgi:uncharacterized integral membrane protein